MPRTGRNCLKAFLLGLILLLGVVFAAGCGAEATPTAPAREVFLDTLVAEAVVTQRAETEQAAQNEAALTSVAQTSAAGQPAVLQAQTLTPSLTPTPDITQTLEAQALITQTPSESGTPLPTLPPLNLPTPTLPSEPTRQPGDPALGLGNFDWQDTFDTNENWTEYSLTNSQVEISEGELRFTVFTPGSGPTWTTSWVSVSNFYMEVLVRTPQTCSGKDSFGLVFRSADLSQGYRYEFSCDGMYHMMAFDENGARTVVAWASSNHLLAGPNQINRMGVWAQGKVVSLYINGAVVAGLPDTEYRTGKFGFAVVAEETENFTVSFDNLTFWTFE